MVEQIEVFQNVYIRDKEPGIGDRIWTTREEAEEFGKREDTYGYAYTISFFVNKY